MIQYDRSFDNVSILRFVIHPQSDPARGQLEICHKSIAQFFEKENSSCNQQLPKVKI